MNALFDPVTKLGREIRRDTVNNVDKALPDLKKVLTTFKYEVHINQYLLAQKRSEYPPLPSTRRALLGGKIYSATRVRFYMPSRTYGQPHTSLTNDATTSSAREDPMWRRLQHR